MRDAHDQLIACIPRLRRYARALVGDRARADDLVQDTMERGWKHLAAWRHDGDMRAWLFSIMHNVYVDQMRRPALVTEALADASSADIFMDRESDEDSTIAFADLEAGLRMLPDEQREILLLVALEEMPYEEVAMTLNVPIGTVMSRLSRARQKLRAHREGRLDVSASSVLKVVK